MTARLFICVPCFNRREVVQACLPTLLKSKYALDTVRLYNDGSSQYDAKWLLELGADWAQDCVRCGPDEQRRMHILDFLAAPEYSHLYFSDSDCLLDPSWRERLLEIHNRTGALTCGYNSPTHEAYKNNTFESYDGIVFRRFAPGCSYLMDREQVEKVANVLPRDRFNHDWFIPGTLGYRCAVSDVSCVDHLGVSGLHDEQEKPGYASRERALNPTDFLRAKRQEVLASLGLRDHE